MTYSLDILRVVTAGTMFLSHGLGKAQNYAMIAPQFPDPLGVGSALSLGLVIFAECVCAILLCFGILVRAVTIPLIITMVVAIFIIHGGDPFAKKELAFFFLTNFVVLFMSGGGELKINLEKHFPRNKFTKWLFV